jgi:predicted PhzF superfamily epimerase YddE/YHI9
MKTYFVDAFTNQKFKRNPSAECNVDDAVDKKLVQNIAFEIGFTETAFV